VLSDSSKRQFYDQTGQSGEGNAAGYNSYNEGNSNQEDIFNQFKGFQNGGNAGGFEDILNDLFGNPRQGKSQSRNESEPSTMNISISF
jgi:DnaJ-class molecular chaperone